MGSNDPSIMAKYKQGYAECMQECVRFINCTGSSLPSSEIDPVAKQRLIANLMKQFQGINQPTAANSVSNPQVNRANNGKYSDMAYSEMCGSSLSPIEMSNSSSLSLSSSPHFNTSNEIKIINNSGATLRRSSVSPISASSSCSSTYYTSNNLASQMNNQSDSNLNSNEGNNNEDSSPNSSSLSSPKHLDNQNAEISSYQLNSIYSQFVWRPW